jgi:hypothetical protein
VPGERLAFYLDNFEGGGMQKTTLTLAGALAARGHPVDVLVCRPSGVLQDQVPPGVEVAVLGTPGLWSARTLDLKSDPGRLGAIQGGVALAPRLSPTLGWLGPLAEALKARRPCGRLVPPGDDQALAETILATLATPPSAALLRERAGAFAVERAATRYERLMLGDPMPERSAAPAVPSRVAAL